MGFMVTQTFPMLRENAFLNELTGGGFSFWLYAVLTLISLLVVLRYVPENQGQDAGGTRRHHRHTFEQAASRADQTRQECHLGVVILSPGRNG